MGTANGDYKACTHTHVQTAKIWLAHQLYSHSQLINPLYLPPISAPPPSDATRRKTVDHRNSYILLYSHRDPTFLDLYRRLAVIGWSDIGHTLDDFTMRTAFFSGFEVRAASGDQAKAARRSEVRSEVKVEDQGASAWRGPEAPMLHTIASRIDFRFCSSDCS
jgi:hypothetical protein